MALVGTACIALGLMGTVTYNPEDYNAHPALNSLIDTQKYFADQAYRMEEINASNI